MDVLHNDPYRDLFVMVYDWNGRTSEWTLLKCQELPSNTRMKVVAAKIYIRYMDLTIKKNNSPPDLRQSWQNKMAQ